MICLGLETSCDETALALVSGGRLLGQALSSQEDLHAVFGGVVPELASREHQRKAASLFRLLLQRTGMDPKRIGAVAVARGPGLLGSLLVGVNLAKGLALGLGVPLVGVNHLHAHLTAAGLERELEFPSLGLLISGGHTHLYRMESPMDFTLLGRTLDDAAGEALDKSAKMVNLPYPGGKHIDLLGRGVEPERDLFPRGNVNNPGLDFSFSGLKSCVARHVAAHPELRLESLPEGPLEDAPEGLRRFCASVNWAVADTLRIKSGRAMDAHPDARRLVVAGGVAANSMIRALLEAACAERGVEAVFPSPDLCTDNAAMVAWLGERLALAGLRHGLDLEAIPRGRPVPLDYSR
ncbi:tRNA N6-adenosine threonylcarbamoyltransferase [Fundidesulfovibrio magnetotacticus]|uniref:tRNA N6-adenosine threonylcarbamoyltransferase n=1 Tax=Fundidesulfovibrio magnetotacticus TaxID=2730080 RepID=A0A6V8LPV8_9BACT|nr:tRNA (adenosine(37)-N6)-threonylcarbamoyltransferase complex transferase subunit TsaD [Fundidesulfovibrio magnetotacticus]GFK94582.1 tRNA N6-adenosine threonylcarbamoyltransferase [Fundidesulfovibrio magnetotacticus]